MKNTGRHYVILNIQNMENQPLVWQRSPHDEHRLWGAEKDWPTCNHLQQRGGKSESFTIWLNILILRSNKLSLPFANRLQVISKRGNSWSGFVPDRFHHEKRWWRRLPRTHPWFSSTSRLSVGHRHQWRVRSAVVGSPQQIFWHISPSLEWTRDIIVAHQSAVQCS